MVAGTAVARGVEFGQGAGTLPITATSIITVTAITEAVIVTIGAIDRTADTDLDEFTRQNVFTSEHIVGGENRVQGSEKPKSGVLDTPEPRSHNGHRHSLADVAELADAQVSEACDGDIVEVQVLSSAPRHNFFGGSVKRTRRFFVCNTGRVILSSKNICHGISTPGVFDSRGPVRKGCINERRSSSSEGNRKFGTCGHE